MQNFNEQDFYLNDNLTASNKNKKEKKKKEKVKRRGNLFVRILLSFFAIFLASVIALLSTALVFVDSKLNKIDYDMEAATTIPFGQEFIFFDEEEIVDFEYMEDATGTTMQEMIKNWVLNDGEKMKKSYVTNILLIGSDASVKDPKRANKTENGNTDVMMIVSIDTKNETVKLVSVMRDSYAYMQQFDKFAKLNAACANGGPAYLVETIEDLLKIKIDGYAMVDFESFVKVVNVLGGVDVEVPQYVANYISKDEKKTFPSGNVTLTGEQALSFCRVRKSDRDGDISRVQRQRQVINAIIDKCKDASLSDINKVMDVILENIKTNIDKDSIINYAARAITEKWMNYEISQLTIPDNHTRYAYTSKATAWVWIVDYPLAAQTTQKFLYDDTNITLPEERETAITIIGGYVEK